MSEDKPDIKQHLNVVNNITQGLQQYTQIIQYFDKELNKTITRVSSIENSIKNIESILHQQTAQYEGVPLNHNNFGTYPIVPVICDPTPIININKISNIVGHHTKLSTAVNALAKKLPFSRVVNYVVAKDMLMDLFKDDSSINLINDIDKNDYLDPIGGIDDLIASFSSTTLQSLRSVGEGKKREYNDIKEEKESYVDVLVAPLPIHLPLIVSSQNVSPNIKSISKIKHMIPTIPMMISTIFDHKEGKCDTNDVDDNIINNCFFLNRIIYAVKYYQSLNPRQSKQAQSTFVKFISEKYEHYLDDVIHLTTKHEQHLELINNALRSNNDFRVCDINLCSLTARHCGINVVENDSKMDPLFLFYQDTFDTIHYYLIHLFETGMRLPQDSSNNDGTDKKMDGLWSCVNAQFLRKKLMLITQRKKLATFFDRFESKTSQNDRFLLKNQNQPKFTIQTSVLFDHDEETFMDELFEVVRKHKNISDKELLSLRNYLDQEELDTDALMSDISVVNPTSNRKQSNLLKDLENQVCAELVYSYIQEIKLKENGFNTGFVFWYWPYYAKVQDVEHNEYEYWNYNDFSGFSVVELYIKSGKYTHLKQEILENNDNEVGIQQYNMVYIKAKQFMKAETVKNIKAKGTDGVDLHYGITLDQSIDLAHLMSLIFRCDFTELCSSFSSTFRKLKANETIESVKNRNQNYYWMSKLIREAVNYYGINGDSGVRAVNQSGEQREIGPFFCGIDKVLFLPSFAIRLCGPQSTTKSRQIAFNFADQRGMILQLNNKYTGGGKHLRFFNCVWLSRYKEENERVFVGGTHLIQVESVTFSSTMENFVFFCNALYWFNAVIAGAPLFGMKSAFGKKGKNNIKLISSLMEQKTYGIHGYIVNSFNMFVLNRKTITINMDYLSRQCSKQFPDVVAWIFGSFVGGVWDKDKYKYEDMNDDTNLLRQAILDVFHATTTVIIYCTNGDGDRSYRFSLRKLLKILSKFRTRKIKCILNGVWKETPDEHNKHYQRRSWLFYTYESLRKRYPSQLQPKTFHSSIKQNKDPYYRKKQDSLTFQSLVSG